MELTEKMFDELFQSEGVYSNDPDDSGGRTIYGITERYDAEAFHKVFTKFQLGDRQAAKETAMIYYRQDYWDKAHCQNIDNDVLAFNVFDAAVNMGVSEAIRILQECLKVATDGIFGAITQAALDNAIDTDAEGLINDYCDTRISHYKKKKGYPKFGKGWTNRVERCRSFTND